MGERAENFHQVDTRNAKSEDYRNVLKEIIKAGVCPFCPENFRWHTNPILHRNGLWLITKSFQPYPDSKHHLLMIGQVHKENLEELGPEDMTSILGLATWAKKRYQIPGGGITMRFGDGLYSGATVKHLHAHLIEPVVKDNKVSPVYFPIG